MRHKFLKLFLLSSIFITLIQCQYNNRNSNFHKNNNQDKNVTNPSRNNRRYQNFRYVFKCFDNSRHWRCKTRTPPVQRPGCKRFNNKNFNEKRYPYTKFGSTGIRRTYNEKINPNRRLVQRLEKLPASWINRRNTTKKRIFSHGFQQYNRHQTMKLRGNYVTRVPYAVYKNSLKNSMRKRNTVVTTSKRPHTWNNFKKIHYHKTHNRNKIQRVPVSRLSNLKHQTYKKHEEGDLMFATKAYKSKPFNSPRQSSNLRFDKKTGIALGKSKYQNLSLNQKYYITRNSTRSPPRRRVLT